MKPRGYAREHDRSFEEMENELNKGALWGVVYGDFMSYLMIFFLVLFSFSLKSKTGEGPTLEESYQTVQQEFGGKISPEMLDKLTSRKREEALSSRLNEMIKGEGLEELAKVEVSRNRVKLLLTAPILFDSGRAEIRPEAQGILDSIAGMLAELDNEIIVEGHTDSVPVSGLFASNWELSGARANAVVSLLIAKGLAPQRLTATGYGEHRPVAPNDTPENRSHNRRIEISLMREVQ